jgi:hypothetical protein
LILAAFHSGRITTYKAVISQWSSTEDADFKPSLGIKDMSSFFEYGSSKEYEIIARAILAKEANSVEEVCARFGLRKEEAVTILNSKEFLAVFKKLERVNNFFTTRRALKVLYNALKNGRGGEKLAAFDIMQELMERGLFKK